MCGKRPKDREWLGQPPAPPTGSTNLVGVNQLSTGQANAIIAAAEALGPDDPIAVVFLPILHPLGCRPRLPGHGSAGPLTTPLLPL